MIFHNHANHNVHAYNNMHDMMQELEIDGRPIETKDLPANIKIGIIEAGMEDGNIILCLETQAPAKVFCLGFGEGFTSDHWLIFDDGDGKFYVLFNEPQDLSTTEFHDEEEIEPEAIEAVRQHPFPQWLVFLTM